VFKSVDGGASWRAVNAGLRGSLFHLWVRVLAIDPATPTMLYAGTADGAFRSANGGASWTAIGAGLDGPFVTALAIDPMRPGTLYAGTGTGGVFKSTDRGASWKPVDAGTSQRTSRPSPGRA
jgi:photosystem II stability/assembly factor-like uncharacterized protein